MTAPVVQDVYDLTSLQEGMLFHARLEPESHLYFEQIVVPFSAALNWNAFRAAWQDVANHHEALRTSFHWEEIATPVQVVHAHAAMAVEAVDLLNMAPGAGPRTLADFQLADRAKGFDLQVPPLFRVSLVRAAADQLCLVLSFHHLILDGWSLQILLRDFAEAYRARASNSEPVLPRAGQYREYLLWAQAQDLDEAERYWRATLDGIDIPAPIWSEGAPTIEPRFDECELVFSAEDSRAAEHLASQCRVTLSTVVQAAWALVLSATTGADDVTFGMTVSGRPGELDGVENMVGLFINTIPLRVRVDPAERVTEWLQAVQKRAFEARQYEFSPLAEVQRWSGIAPGRRLFDSIIAFENYPVVAAGDPRETDVPGAPGAATFAERTNYPVSAIVVPGEQLTIRLLFDHRFLDPAAARRLIDRFHRLVQELEPSSRLREISLLTADDQPTIDSLHGPSAPVPECGIHDWFEQHLSERRDHVALEFGGETWTYGELDACAEDLAADLQDRGVDAGDRVAIFAVRSAEFVIAALAVLKAGAAYVPIDPANPVSRTQTALAATNASVLLVDQANEGAAADFGCPTLVVTTDIPCSVSARSRRPGAASSDAYVMFTSGSTGEPKGIVIPHAAVNRLALNTDYVALGADDVVANMSNASFDAATFELWGALLNGARLVGIDDDTALSVDRFVDFVRSKRVTTLFVTTALFNRIAAERPDAFSSLNTLLFGGEAVDPKWVRHVRFSEPPNRLLHVYGPTECTTFATWHHVRELAAGTLTVPIGRGIANTSVAVLDKQLRPVPVGVVGELYLGGAGLAHGYLGDPRLTATSFVPRDGGDRLYRTGDLVRVTPDGIVFVGRTDGQVKLRGFRIEVGEIERVVLDDEAVASCVVQLHTANDGDQSLVAYVGSAQSNQAGFVEHLRLRLDRRLPRYMRPAHIVALASLPLNSNGKIDRRALPTPVIGRAESAATPPESEIEIELARIWQQVLGADVVGIDDDFFDLGGHSLKATQMLSRIQRDLGVDLELREVFDAPTIRGLAELIATADSPSGHSAIETLPRGTSGSDVEPEGPR